MYWSMKCIMSSVDSCLVWMEIYLFHWLGFYSEAGTQCVLIQTFIKAVISHWLILSLRACWTSLFECQIFFCRCLKVLSHCIAYVLTIYIYYMSALTFNISNMPFPTFSLWYLFVMWVENLNHNFFVLLPNWHCTCLTFTHLYFKTLSVTVQ